MEEDIKNMSKEELLEYLEDISQQLDNIALDQIQFAISELQFFKEEYKKLEEENKELEKQLEEKDMQHELELIGKEEYTKASMGEIIEHYYTAKEECIPTSVIQKKIEEVNNSNGYSPVNKIFIEKVLNEILEEGRR